MIAAGFIDVVVKNIKNNDEMFWVLSRSQRSLYVQIENYKVQTMWEIMLTKDKSAKRKYKHIFERIGGLK